MPVRWFYQSQAGVVGPVSLAELKYLITVGKLGISTLVRRGDDGAWLAADQIEDILETSGSAERAGESASEIPDWHFNLRGQSKQGPLPWSDLKRMIAGGTLQPDDLVWKPGMAMWVSASRVPGLMEELSPPAVREAGLPGMFGVPFRPRILWAGVAVTALLGLLATVFGWTWTQIKSRDQPDAGVMRTRAEMAKGDRRKGGLGEVERWLDDARTAVRVEQLDRAMRLLDQYLASPLATEPESAKLLLREIKLATSIPDAALIARNLADEPLKAYLHQGVQPLVAAIETAELRPIYERTLLQAFRQENNRRQMIPRGAFAQNPAPVPAGAIAKNQAEPVRPAVQENPVADENDGRPAAGLGLIAIEFNDVAKKPDAFMGKTLLLNGLFKIGTKISEVRGRDGQVLGWSLPVARNDDGTVFTGDRKVEKNDVVMLLDDQLAKFLQHVFNKLNLRTTIKPSYKCILTVTIRQLLVNGAPTPVVVISAMEVLGGCDYLSVARHQYSHAFRTLKVTAGEADVDFGDGELWVERLGGEEDFVQPIRRKFREMQRRAITNRDRAVIDRILQRQLANAMSTASAINHIVAMEGLRRMRILP